MAKEVYSKTLKRVIDVDEFVSLENVNKIGEGIYCSIKDCKAKFVYHSTSETKEHHFQKFPGEEHSEVCEFKNSGIIYRNKKHSEKIKASLDSDGYDSTLNTMLSFLKTKLRPTEENPPEKRKKRKPKIKSKDDEEDGPQYNFEFTSNQSKEEQEKIKRLKENNVKLRRPSIFRKTLNQLSEKHSFSHKKTYAIIKSIKQINNHAFEISIKDIDTEKKSNLDPYSGVLFRFIRRRFIRLYKNGEGLCF